MSIVTFPVGDAAPLRRLLLTMLAALIAIGVIWSLAAAKAQRCVTVPVTFSAKDFGAGLGTSRRVCEQVSMVAYFFGSAASLIDRQPLALTSPRIIIDSAFSRRGQSAAIYAARSGSATHSRPI